MDAQIRSFDDLKNKYEHIHFIGVGGAGMAPLAHLVLGIGCTVSGSDALWSSKLDELQEAGATVYEGHEAGHLPESVDWVVISSAIDETNPELLLARRRELKVLRRGEFLAVLCGSFNRCVAIGGSHGKTSVTAMLSYLLRQCNVDCGFMIGGGVNEFPSFRLGDGDIFVTEVDESDGTISCMYPEFGVLNNAEDDHAWSLGGVEQLKNIYRKFILQSRNFVCFNDDNILDLIPEDHENNLIIVPDDSVVPDNFIGFQRRNGQMAIALAMLLGIDPEQAVEALRSFPGVKRRMTVHYSTTDLVVIEDYAHHPTELKNSLEFLNLKYPNYHKCVIFQPHRVERLKRYFNEFVEIFSGVDSVIVSEVFAAWLRDAGCSGKDLADKLTMFNKNVYWGGNNLQFMADLALNKVAAVNKPTVIAVIGAGDINNIFRFLPRENHI